METSYQQSALTVPQLPPRKDQLPPYAGWSVSSTLTALDSSNMPATCDRHGLGSCNQETDDEVTLDQDMIRDVVIGLSDGLTVPFALTAGLSGLGDARLVVVAGAAELLAGAISMGVGGFLASQSERDYGRYLRRRLNQRMERSCSGQMERDVHAILGPVGVDEKVSRQVARNLLDVEEASRCGSRRESRAGSRPSSSHSVDERTSLIESSGHRRGSADEEDQMRWNQDVGITAFLLKFGEGMEDVPTRRLYISAFTIGFGYFIGGLIPLIPYFFTDSAQVALLWSAVITGIILLLFGGFRTHISGGHDAGIGGYIKGAINMFLVGGTAAGSAYAIVAAMEGVKS